MKKRISLPVEMQYARARTKLCGAVLNMSRMMKKHYEPKVSLGEFWDLLLVVMHIFMAHAKYNQGLSLHQIETLLGMPSNIVKQKIKHLCELGLIELIEGHYWGTEKFNPPEKIQQELFNAHWFNMQIAEQELERVLNIKLKGTKHIKKMMRR